MDVTVIDHTEQLPDIDSLILSSNHTTEEAIPDTKKLHITMAMEEIEGVVVPKVNCFDLLIKENGGLVLWSHAPINEHYPAYPQILFDAHEAKELLTFLKKHEELLNTYG